jgi:hypothetical protein
MLRIGVSQMAWEGCAAIHASPRVGAYLRGIGIPTALDGIGTHLTADLTLTEAEAEIANRFTDGYNAYLKRKACSNFRLTLVDINRLLLDDARKRAVA